MRYGLLQKYGVVNPKIDRNVRRPKWMEIKEWKRKLSEWYKITKGMVTGESGQRLSHRSNQTPASHQGQHPQKQFNRNPKHQQNRNRDNRQRGTRGFHRNSGPTRMETRQN